MPTAFLYRLDAERNSNFVKSVSVDTATFADLERNYRVTWCADHGYDDTHYLRTRKRIETSTAEREALQRDHDALRHASLLPSALTAVIQAASTSSKRRERKG